MKKSKNLNNNLSMRTTDSTDKQWKDDRRKEYYLQNKETLLAKKRLWYVKKQKEVKAEQRQVHIDLKKRVLQVDLYC